MSETHEAPERRHRTTSTGRAGRAQIRCWHLDRVEVMLALDETRRLCSGRGGVDDCHRIAGVAVVEPDCAHPGVRLERSVVTGSTSASTPRRAVAVVSQPALRSAGRAHSRPVARGAVRRVEGVAPALRASLSFRHADRVRTTSPMSSGRPTPPTAGPRLMTTRARRHGWDCRAGTWDKGRSRAAARERDPCYSPRLIGRRDAPRAAIRGCGSPAGAADYPRGSSDDLAQQYGRKCWVGFEQKSAIIPVAGT